MADDLNFQKLSTVQNNLQPFPVTLASAATIAPTTFLTFLTGTTQVTTITPPVTGQHFLCLIFTNAAPGGLGTGGNINATVITPQNAPVYLVYDPIGAKYYAVVGSATTTASAQSQPSNPTQTNSGTYVMMGLAGAITPVKTGKILAILSGDVTATNGNTATMQLSFGTGAAPANAAAVTGTQYANQPTFTALTGLLTVPFSLQGITAAQALGTALWFDLALKSSSGNVSVTNLSLTLLEVA